MTALVLGVLLSAFQAQTPNDKTADGFYCATDRYFAYETLLHDSPAAHLLHLVSLDDRAGIRRELTLEVPAEPARRIGCMAEVVVVQGETTTTFVDVNLRSWVASRDPRSPAEPDIRWVREPSRLWGTGS